MEKISHVNVNTNTGIATVGGGTVYQQAIDAIYAAGREMSKSNPLSLIASIERANPCKAVGSCPCVGVLGAALGGGHGRLQGLHGMSIDALRRLRVVLASGKVITVSATENADLWWGIRGAGQNFGIVVEADFQTYPQVPQGKYYDVEMQFADDQLEKVFELMNRQIKAPLPAELAVDIVFGANATTLKVCFQTHLMSSSLTTEERDNSN